MTETQAELRAIYMKRDQYKTWSRLINSTKPEPDDVVCRPAPGNEDVFTTCHCHMFGDGCTCGFWIYTRAKDVVE